MNETRTVRYFSFIGVIGSTGFLFAPLVVAWLVGAVGWTQAAAGSAVGLELIGATLGAAGAARFPENFAARRFARVVLGIIACASLASLCATTFAGFAGLRVLTGFGEGAALTVAYARLSMTRSPDRSFALLLALSLIVGATGLYAVPLAAPNLGIPVLYAAIAAAAVILALVPQPGRDIDLREGALAEKATARRWPLVGVASVAVLGLFITQGAVWTFAERIASDSRISERTTGAALAVSNLGGLAGALLAAAIAERIGLITPIAFGGLGSVAVIWALSDIHSGLQFGIAILALQFLWCWSIPYFMGVLARIVQDGSVMAAGVVSQLAGLALGPIAASLILEEGGTLVAIIASCAALALISTATGVAAASIVRRQQAL